MDMLKQKKGLISGSILDKAIGVIIGVVLLFELYAALVPTAQTSGDTLNASGVPLGNLFTSQGAVFILLMAGLLIVIVKAVMGNKK